MCCRANSRSTAAGVHMLVPLLLLFAGPKLLSAVPLASFYPYGMSAGDSMLPRNDDGVSGAIPLSIPFNFFARSPTSLYVSLYSLLF